MMDLGLDKIPHHQIRGLRFGVYSIKEIEKLSVLEVTNINTFDALGHPSPCGLYDLRLGSSDRDDVCGTCGLNSQYCPGHFGHVKLSLPVFNPFFFRTLHKILQGVCFECHHLLVSPLITQLTLYQLKALEHGLMPLAQELEEKVSQYQESLKEGGKSSVEETIELKNYLSNIVDKAIEENVVASNDKCVYVKNIIECRIRIVKNFLRSHLGKGRKCNNCGASKTSLNVHNNTRLIMGKKSKITPAKKKPVLNRSQSAYEDYDEVEDEENTVNDSLNLTLDDTLKGQTYLTPLDARKHLRKVWKNNQTLLQELYSIFKDVDNQNESPIDIFFLDAVIVPPNKFRPLCALKGKKFENPQTQQLNKVLGASITLNQLVKCMKADEENVDQNLKDILKRIPGKTEAEKLHHSWNELQMAVNNVVDSDLDKLTAEKKKIPGIKQLLEKKEGLFRKHMMGKRVNYAARSVISPDPYIMVDEIGVPMVFAAKLTYPQPVTPWNVRQLREAVINGPDVHPGAVLVENEDGSIIKLNAKHKVQREGIAKQLLTPSQVGNRGIRNCKIVYRHLLNGDVLLLNRQPTLHKPSIMAHKARVLPGEKTLRLHYANCKTYNADFDGDEMNAHFPQSETARAEAYNIACVRNQFLVPKDGTPLSGLIQDHMIAGVSITMRGSFFNREDYQGLVYGALTFVRKNIKTLPPAIQKPRVLWSGKQILSTIILNVIPEGVPPPSLEGKSKIANKTWQTSKEREWLAGGTPLKGDVMSEAEVIIHEGELLCGVLDKAHYGPTAFGLVHLCYEIYGGETSCLLLTSLARLFTHYLQIHSGFSLGIEDILVTPKANKKRWRIMKKARQVGNEAAAEALGVTDKNDLSEIRDKFEGAHRNRDDIGLKQLDNSMKSKTDSVNNEINKVCFPNGLFKLFPSNNLQLMVQSGAKGSTVNCMQISCLLGQIELEGRRVPLMMSGKTLPSFLPYDTCPRAGGFIDGRFLTGIRPQEFFFHCMAGREGLVDTAVKTSRSGYLQRCLIKHLEGLIVNYDLTVRDSDGSVVQFYYGEDGLDIMKRQLLNPKIIPVMVRNHDALMKDVSLNKIADKVDFEATLSPKKKIKRWKKKRGDTFQRPRLSGFTLFSRENKSYFDKYLETGKIGHYEDCKAELQKAWWDLDQAKKEKYLKKTEKPPDPVFSHLRSDLYFGAIGDKWEEDLEVYEKNNPENLLESAVVDFDVKPNLTRTQRKSLPIADFKNMMYYRTMRSLCDPGEAVGLLAAQSIGEPSTQMTLNTFHFAGRGEMNVTLGIPRLREILMTASANIATPSMDLPLLTNTDDVEQRAEKLRVKLNTARLSDVLERIDVVEEIQTKDRKRTRYYRVKFLLLPHKCYKDKYCVNPKKVLAHLEHVFFKKLLTVIKKKLSEMASSSLISFRKERKTKSREDEDDEGVVNTANQAEDGGDSSDEGEGDGDTTSSKQRMRHDQETEYDDPEMEETELNDEEDEFGQDEDEGVETSFVKTEFDRDENEESVDSPKIKRRKHSSVDEDTKAFRIHNVTNLSPSIEKYDFDSKKELWCQIDFALDMVGSKIDMTSLLEMEAKSSVVHQVKGINRAFLVKDHKAKGGCGKMLKTDGVNFLEMFKYEDVLDVKKVYSNDIHAIANTYGIEAAARAVAREVTNVFAAYGIEVDPRHLLLVADYMTFDGTFRACNRATMEYNASPLQQMTFETTMTFLRNATLTNSQEELKSPSARLILGRLVQGGTGCFELRKPGIKR